jgi:hypothetical protein
MPNRMLREGIVESRKMAQVYDSAKVLYYKLMSVADDFGRFEADPELLRRRLYMWETERVSAHMVAGWLKECADKDLIRLYEFSGKKYLEILNFKQQVRAKSKYPDEHGDHTPAPPKSKSAHSSTEVKLLANDNNCDQSKTNALAPTRLDSTRLDSNKKEESSETLTEDENPKPSNVTVMPSMLGIEGWAELIELASRAGMSFDPDPTCDLCQRVWRKRDFKRRLESIRGIQVRIDCGQYSADQPQFSPTLRRYIEQNLDRETLRPRAAASGMAVGQQKTRGRGKVGDEIE